LDSYDFYTIKPLWVDGFRTVIKNLKAFCFGHDFEVCLAKILIYHMLIIRKKISFGFLTVKIYTSEYSLDKKPLCLPSPLFDQNLEEWKGSS
jgi:hypothetical protein